MHTSASRRTTRVQPSGTRQTVTQKKTAAKPQNGLPENLKNGIEKLSGFSMDDVKVHRNSSKPSQLQAHAYAQGSDIHLAPGQDRHLPHEAWHVVQQKQGRVKASRQLKSNVPLNTDITLEKEADRMGAKAASGSAALHNAPLQQAESGNTVQRVPEWLQSLITLAQEHPIGTATTLVVGAGTLLGYYYYRQRQQKKAPNNTIQHHEDEGVPDWSTYEGVAGAIGVDPEVLRDQLENGGDTIDMSQVYKKGFDRRKEKIPGLVPPSLIENLEGSAQTRLDALFARFNNWPFTYTGRIQFGASSFLTRQGDCKSLAEMFQLAAHAIGIEVELNTDPHCVLVESRPIHGRETDGNTDGIRLWHFFDHTWCVFNGQRYDLLFMMKGAPEASFQSGDDHEHQGILYELYPNGLAYISSEECEKIGVMLSGGSEGLVVKASAVESFISEHKK
ncbi:MAG: eCIS core domain-containing protein [Flavobacteriales bacterium]